MISFLAEVHDSHFLQCHCCNNLAALKKFQGEQNLVCVNIALPLCLWECCPHMGHLQCGGCPSQHPQRCLGGFGPWCPGLCWQGWGDPDLPLFSALQQKKSYLERSVKEAEDNIREMLMARRAQ